MTYQPTFQGVIIVSPSPSVGGTPCRNSQTSVNNVLLAWVPGEKIYAHLAVIEADAQVTYTTNGGWKRHKHLAQINKHDLSTLAPPKIEMKRSFSWTSIFKSATSSS